MQMRAVSSIASAYDQSNVLSESSTQLLPAPFQENAKALNALLQHLHGKVARVCGGGGAKAVERHRKRNKLLPRERVAAFLDPGSPFLELSQLAGYNLYGNAVLLTSITPSYLIQQEDPWLHPGCRYNDRSEAHRKEYYKMALCGPSLRFYLWPFGYLAVMCCYNICLPCDHNAYVLQKCRSPKRRAA